MKPFVRWAGGKRFLAKTIVSRLPPLRREARYLEPFLGGGAVFWELLPEKALLSDTNQHLISAWQVLQESSSRLIGLLKFACRNAASDPKGFYYALREQNPRDKSARALRCLYLQANSFNGLWRENKSGGMNSPWGKYDPPRMPNLRRLQECEEVLSGSGHEIGIVDLSYEVVLEGANRGDVVYADPPYLPLTPTANFSSYQAGGFTLKDQVALAHWLGVLAEQKIYMALSNHATPLARGLYKGWRVETFSAPRKISCKSATRDPVDEILVMNYDENLKFITP